MKFSTLDYFTPNQTDSIKTWKVCSTKLIRDNQKLMRITMMVGVNVSAESISNLLNVACAFQLQFMFSVAQNA